MFLDYVNILAALDSGLSSLIISVIGKNEVLSSTEDAELPLSSFYSLLTGDILASNVDFVRCAKSSTCVAGGIMSCFFSLLIIS